MGLGHSPSIVTNGLVGCWDVASPRSSPGSGTTWTDLSKNGNNGTLTNSPIFAGGINKGIIDFDGTDDYVDLGDILDFERTDSFTFTLWINLDTIALDYPKLVDKRKNDSSKRGYQFFLGGSSEPSHPSSLGMTLTSTNVSNDIVAYSPDNSIKAGVWQHAVLTYSGNSDVSGVIFYIDGVQQATQTVRNGLSATILNDVSLTIASPALGSSDDFLNGRIANCYVYNRALTAAEIKQNYNATKGRFSITSPIVKENLVLHLDAGDSDSYGGSGTTWTDLAGSNDATLTNGPVYSSAGGGSFALDGTNDYGAISSHSSFQFGSNTDYTLEIWFRFDDYASGGAGWDKPLITNHLTSDNPRTGWMLGLAGYAYGTEGQARAIATNSTPYGNDFGPGTDPTYGSGTDGTLINDGNWHHLLLTVDRDGNAVIYVNGVAEVSSSMGTTANIDNTKELWLGRHQWSGGVLTLEGNISIVRIYNKSLTSGEVLQNYEALKGRFV